MKIQRTTAVTRSALDNITITARSTRGRARAFGRFPRWARTALVFSICGLPLIAIVPVLAYEKDTHFGLTYYLARRVGFTKEQARRIATATWSIDIDPNTEPLHAPIQFVPVASSIPGAPFVSTLISPNAQDVRVKFHAFLSEWLSSEPPVTDSLTKFHVVESLMSRPSSISRRLDELWKNAKTPSASNYGNPGVYIHYMQDIYAHTGYFSVSGHALPAGHSVDYLSDDENKYTSPAMALRTVEDLRHFLEDQKFRLNPTACQPDPNDVREIVKRLIRANPASIASPVPKALNDALDRGEWFQNAEKVLNKALPDDDRLPTLVDTAEGDYDAKVNTRYRFDSEGRVQLRPTGPKGGGYFSDTWRVLEGRPIDYILERWVPVGKQADLRFVAPDTSRSDENAIMFWGRDNMDTEWKGTYDPATMRWVLLRTPTQEEMDQSLDELQAPASEDKNEWTAEKEWVKTRLKRGEITGKPQWRMELRLTACELTGKFFPGMVKWRAVKIGESFKGEVWIPADADGWGRPRDVKFVRYWPEF